MLLCIIVSDGKTLDIRDSMTYGNAIDIYGSVIWAQTSSGNFN